jgi:uncharacterized protein YprB with RNaseH-like and TPR domain
MAGKLRERLGRIRALAEKPLLDSVTTREKGVNREPFPDGWEVLSEGLRFRESLDPFPFASTCSTLQLGPFSRRLTDSYVNAGDLVFFDLETTGLSGGSGTVAFLAAFGSIRDDGFFSVRQYFMDDYPSEPAFLDALEHEFSSAKAVASYNGASFDMPLHAVRRSMNGLGSMVAIQHVDVLHASRRLWRRKLVDCSLGNIEASVLGVFRSNDIPGAEVPAAWFDYVKRGQSELLARVFNHNELDIRSLARLFFLIIDASLGCSLPPYVDMVGLAELQSRIDHDLAERTLKTAIEAGDSRAVRPLMRLYRIMGRLEERSALIPALPDDAAGYFSRSIYAQRTRKDSAEALRLALLAASIAKEQSGLMVRIQNRIIKLTSMSGNK